MNELKRNYNTILFNGVELSRIILTDGKDFISVSPYNVFFKIVTSYQYFDYELNITIKKGNKNSINDKLPLDKVLSQTSITYNQKDRLDISNHSGGDVLFLKVDFENMITTQEKREEETYTHVTNSHTFKEFKDLIFITHHSEINKQQASIRLYKNLKTSVKYLGNVQMLTTKEIEGFDTLYRLQIELEFYNFVTANADKFQVDILKEYDGNGVNDYKGIVTFQGEEIYRTRINSTQEAINEFYKYHCLDGIFEDFKHKLISEWSND